MVKKKIRDLREKIERFEVAIEDIVIIVLAFIVLLLVLGMSDLYVQLSTQLNKPAYLSLVLLGWAILPWVIMLGILLIARDLWIMRRIMEKAVKIEAKIEKEIKEKEKE